MARATRKPLATGDVVRFDGAAVDGSVSGFMLVTVIDPHSNAAAVTHSDKHGEYESGRTHIRQALVERPAYKDRPARQFVVNVFNLREESRA